MKKYILNKITNDEHNGIKATADIVFFLTQLNFNYFDINIPHRSSKFQKIGCLLKLTTQLKKLKTNDLFVFQYPTYLDGKNILDQKIINYCKKNNVKLIALIHDVNSLRYEKNNNLLKEINFLNQFDTVICPTKAMQQILVENGLKVKTEILEIYDYKITNYKDKPIQFSKKINFAGNLNKSLFLDKLNTTDIGSYFDLYGPIDDKNRINNLNYFGSFPSDELIKKLNNGFGLVWDGDSLETVTGKIGEYTKFNSPHKLSLHLAIGMPVFVWKESAMYDFVRDNQVGFGVDSLYEIKEILENITEDEFNELACNAQKIGFKLREGFYIKKAVQV